MIVPIQVIDLFRLDELPSLNKAEHDVLLIRSKKTAQQESGPIGKDLGEVKRFVMIKKKNDSYFEVRWFALQI